MAKNDSRVLDSDMHIMEPPDLWERYIVPEFRDIAPRGTTSQHNVQDLRTVFPLDYTYDFFANEVWPAYPHVRPEQFSDAISELGKTNEKVRTFNPATILDDSFVQDAEKRGLGK